MSTRPCSSAAPRPHPRMCNSDFYISRLVHQPSAPWEATRRSRGVVEVELEVQPLHPLLSRP